MVSLLNTKHGTSSSSSVDASLSKFVNLAIWYGVPGMLPVD